VATQVFSKQLDVVSATELIMTVDVYGLFAGIVKLDDLGLYTMLKKGTSVCSQVIRKIGSWLLADTPYLRRFLGAAGTAAMFLAGGSIIGHNVPVAHHLSECLIANAQNLPAVGGFLKVISPMLVDALVGIIVGTICMAIFTLI
jgi:uncharacterized protein